MYDEKQAIGAILDSGWIKHVVWQPSLDSTNSEAKRWLSGKRQPTPALFVADEQTAGRGRSDHQWWSPPGCLMLTLVVDSVQFPSDPQRWSELALVCGVAVSEAISEFVDAPIHLKWPNDVYVNRKKCGGILIESGPPTNLEPSKNSASVNTWLVGIGLNVNVDWTDAPRDVAQKATCLSTNARQPVDLEVVLVELLRQLEQRIVFWKLDQEHWQTPWSERCLLSGKWITARIPDGSELHGLCEGIDALGRLTVRQERQVHSLISAEILHWQD